MAVGSRSTNTMAEGMRALLSSISDMKILPDADLQFILGIEQQIVAKLREPIDRMQQQGITQAGPPQGPPPGSMAGAMTQGGMPGQSAGAGGGGVPGVMQARQQPNPDELRRVLMGAGGPA